MTFETAANLQRISPNFQNNWALSRTGKTRMQISWKTSAWPAEKSFGKTADIDPNLSLEPLSELQTKIITANWVPKVCFLQMIKAKTRPSSAASRLVLVDVAPAPPAYVTRRHNMDKRLQTGGVSRPASARLLPTFPDREAERGRRQMTRGRVPIESSVCLT